MKLSKEKLLANKHGFLEGTEEVVGADISTKVKDYKLLVIKSYCAINPDQIDKSFGEFDFYVTRKYDGEFNIIYFDEGEIVLINRNGNVKAGLPILDEARQCLVKAGVGQALIPAELYFDESAGRTRVFDVLKALADAALVPKLRLAPFEIVELDGKPFPAASYGDTHARLESLFPRESRCVPVDLKKARNAKEIREIYKTLVEEGGSEGLVVHTPFNRVFKIKPKYSVDVAVVGFSEGTGESKGQMRTLLLALMTDDGKFQIVGRTGGGFTEEDRVSFLQRLLPKVIASRYIETDSNHVAFRMIRPEMVAELQVNDVLFETSSGPIMNSILEIRGDEYVLHGTKAGISFVSPIFVRERTDKTVTAADVRFDQLSEFQPLIAQESVPMGEDIPKASVICREVYKKETGGKLMVHKFIVFKTGKEKINPAHPAYVLHHTDYSSERKERLQREIRVSSDEGQIMRFLEIFRTENIKKGWAKV